jgi:hypothetical protein
MKLSSDFLWALIDRLFIRNERLRLWIFIEGSPDANGNWPGITFEMMDDLVKEIVKGG